MDKYRVHELVQYNYSDIGEYIDEYHTDRPLRNDILVDKLNEYDKLDTKCSQLEKENEQLKSENMEMTDYVGRLEEEKINLQIKLQKIRDYAEQDGEVKQGVIEKVVFE